MGTSLTTDNISLDLEPVPSDVSNAQHNFNTADEDSNDLIVETILPNTAILNLDIIQQFVNTEIKAPTNDAETVELSILASNAIIAALGPLARPSLVNYLQSQAESTTFENYSNFKTHFQAIYDDYIDIIQLFTDQTQANNIILMGILKTMYNIK